MKKLIIALLIALPAISMASIDVNLKYGSQGQEVVELQEYLIDKGFLSTTATGNFYSLTKKAVIAYQKSVNLPTTGFVGPMTRDIINKDLADNTSPEEQAIPVVINNDTKVLQDKVDALNAQVKAMADQNKAQNDVNTQLFGAIVQNTTPLNTTKQEILPKVIPQFIDLNGDEGTTTTISLMGESCQPFIGNISVKYSDGSLVKEPYRYTTQNGNDHGTNNGTFVYRSQLKEGTDIVNIITGDISKEIKFNILPKIDISNCY